MNSEKRIIKLLILEDEMSVIRKFLDIVENINSASFLENKDFLVSITTDMSTIGRFNLDEFDAIFVDRDNALNRSGEFHTHYLKLLQESPESVDKIEIIKRTYPMSGSGINNNTLINNIVKTLSSIINKSGNNVAGLNYYIDSREDQRVVESILKANTITKSFPNLNEKLKSVIIGLTMNPRLIQNFHNINNKRDSFKI